MKIIRCIIAFILFSVLGAIVAYLLYLGFTTSYPTGLRVEKWLVVFALMFFSFIFFFTLILLVDILNLLFNPLRALAYGYRVVGMTAIALYLFACVMSLKELWVRHHNFIFNSSNDMMAIRIAMAVLMTILTITTFGICINSAWGPKDQTKRKS